MQYIIIWKNSDGHLLIDNMAPNYGLEATTAFKDSRIAKGVYQPSQFCAILKHGNTPDDRYFRDAWRWNGAGIDLDLIICRQRHLNKLRRERNKKLIESDAEFMHLFEINDIPRLNALKTYRQQLRDMPQTIEPILRGKTTPQEIRATRPIILDTKQP